MKTHCGNGSIAGNAALGSRVHLTNGHWFSYPGYSEMLTGHAHDDAIKSNDPYRNPYPTVLEFLKGKASLSRDQTAVFTSWDNFNFIAEHTADRRDHGRKIDGASETWMAFVAPQMPRRGEWRNQPLVTTSQVAATLVRWMGMDWRAFDASAAPPVQ